MNIKGSLFDSAWYVALRKADYPIFRNENDQKPFKILNNSLRYWCADPFLFFREEKLYIFMELYDMFAQRGVIGYRVFHHGRLSRIHVCLKTPYHLSYPYVFEKDGEVYMLPESYQSGKLTLYKSTKFPDIWEPCEDLLAEASVCDTDYIRNENGEFLLTTPVFGEKFSYDLLEMYKKEDGVWQKCGNDPIIRNASCARNAGMPFSYEGKKYRQAQNCSEKYGENLIFHEILKCDGQGYSERKSAEVFVGDIVLAGTKNDFTGIHTYNRTDEYEVIDLYCDSVFQPLRFIRLLMMKIKNNLGEK